MMADITKCTNQSCVLKHQCLRYKVLPRPFNQSYADFDCKGEKVNTFFRDNGSNKKTNF